MGALVLALGALLVSLDPAGGAREVRMALSAAGAPGGGGHIPRRRLLAGWVRSALLRGAGAAPQGRT